MCLRTAVTLTIVRLCFPTGLYRTAKASAGFVRGLFGVSGQEYYEFTTEGVLLPDVFQHLEWHCFSVLFEAMEHDARFKESAEYNTYQQLLDEERAHRHEEFVRDYERYRLMTIQQWTRGFCEHEREMYNKASEIVEVFMKREIDLIYKKCEREEVHRRRVELRHQEQSAYEAETLLVEDVYFWTEDNILDGLYDYYTRSLINKMLEMPELRKGLLQYGGFLKAQSRHMHLDPAAGTGELMLLLVCLVDMFVIC